MSKAPPWKLPASDPYEGSFDEVLTRVRRELVVGQTWAVGQHQLFRVERLAVEDAWGTVQAYDGEGQLRWERPHSFWFGFFAGRMINQDRRPVRWDPEPEEERHPTTARAALLEVD